ncbi:MAG: efflux RND transporter permease subunit, partial [Nitrospiraceae bacterium]
RHPIRLRDIDTLKLASVPETDEHYKLKRTMYVMASVTSYDLGKVAAEVEQAVAEVSLPKGVTVTIKGEVDSMRSAISGFAGVLPLAIVLIYLVMVGLFRSYLDPLIIIFAVPLGFIGVIWMLLLSHTSVNVESMIGTLMMIGIVVANSVLLVDFANNRIREGAQIEEAVVEAGKLRIRPILMTALATVFGLGPMALGIGEGSEMNIPLARAVIGGLLVSTVMTLLVIPVMQALVHGRSAGQAKGQVTQ